jgi:hypothetical protein
MAPDSRFPAQRNALRRGRRRAQQQWQRAVPRLRSAAGSGQLERLGSRGRQARQAKVQDDDAQGTQRTNLARWKRT